jgi:transcriptional regulator with XRE-family HTH domain
VRGGLKTNQKKSNNQRYQTGRRSGCGSLGWRRDDLAAATGLHRNAIAYWERRKDIPSPSHADTPHACRLMKQAFNAAGVVMVNTPGPGAAIRPPAEAERAAAEARGMFAKLCAMNN